MHDERLFFRVPFIGGLNMGGGVVTRVYLPRAGKSSKFGPPKRGEVGRKSEISVSGHRVPCTVFLAATRWDSEKLFLRIGWEIVNNIFRRLLCRLLSNIAEEKKNNSSERDGHYANFLFMSVHRQTESPGGSFHFFSIPF